jgi:hypothetical protein
MSVIFITYFSSKSNAFFNSKSLWVIDEPLALHIFVILFKKKKSLKL